MRLAKSALLAKAKWAAAIVLAAMVLSTGVVATFRPAAVGPQLIFQCGKGNQGSEQVELAGPVTTAS